MQENERFERYTPQFPLPVDIASMSRQDTVCQFCGVSYLIHNEIKALEVKCEKLELELSRYINLPSREAALEESLEKERTLVRDLQKLININTKKFDELTRIRQKESEENQRRTSEILSNFRQIKNEFVLLNDFYSKEKKKIDEDFRIGRTTLQREIQNEFNRTKLLKENLDRLASESKEIQKKLEFDVQTAKETIRKQNDEITELKIVAETIRKQNDELSQLQLDVQSARETIRKQNDEISELKITTQTVRKENDELSQLQLDVQSARETIRKQNDEISELKITTQTIRKENDELSQLKFDVQSARETIRRQKDEISRLENDLIEKTEAKRNVDRLIEKIRQDLTNEKQLRLEKENEFERQISTNESKHDETIRSRQAVLDRTRDEYEKLLGKYHELDELYRQLTDNRSDEIAQNEKIRCELENLHHENLELTKQKETMNIVHEIQMKKLQETYGERLRDAEHWPDRLQSELNREREKHRIEINELERRLKENFATELRIEKEKSIDLMRKYENERGYSTQQLRHELVSTEKVTLEQRQFYEEQIEQMKNDKQKLKNDLETLRNVLKELHEQIHQKESNVDQRVDVLQLKEELLSKETKLFQCQTTIDELTKELEQAKDEMNTLQETVHRECLEREQLKDSLIEARQQLLTLKKNGILNGTTASRNLHSPPLAFDNIERRVSGPLPFSTNFHSEPASRDGSVAEQTADPSARPMSSNRFGPTRPKALPPIRPQGERRREELSLSQTNKVEQLAQNKQRIARFIKHIK